jgi:predicted enzyme related to lactoylglutathione lyase
MSLELEQVVIDAADPVALGEWWADALGWVVVDDDPEEFEIRPAPNMLPGLLFARVPEAKAVKDRLHLDLATQTLEEQAATIERLLAAGATRTDIGQGDVDWEVLSDPEGNEFSVLAPNPATIGWGKLAAIAIDAQDPGAIAPFWAAVTGWQMEPPDEGGDITIRDPARPAPYLDILSVPEDKTHKNRLHLDFRPDDRDAEVARILDVGATRADVGQGEQTWVVLADPAGNEFCVLSSRAR